MVTMLRVYAWDLSHRVTKSEEAATAVEYGIMVALIAAVIVAIVAAVGGATKEAFKDTCDEIVKPASVSSTCP